MAKPEKKLTQRELSAMEADRRKQERKERAEEIDRLLDEKNDYTTLRRMFPDEVEYEDRLFAIDAKLLEISGGNDSE